MKEQIIRLEPDDDVTSVRERLGWVQATHVLLVFPKDPRARILQRKLDLILLQREATRNAAQIALITHDPIVLDSARELGIATFPSVQASRRKAWETARAQISVNREDQPVPLVPELAEAASRLRTPTAAPPRQMSRQAKLTIASVVILAGVIGALLIVPGANIEIRPAANQVSVTTTITADPSPDAPTIDESAATIRARLVGVEVEGQASVETTGSIEQPSEKARGVALFTNRIPNQVTIPAGTIVRTSAAQPVRFVTLADATVPGNVGATVQVPIESVNPGFEGNLPVGRVNQIEGSLSTALVVTNSQPTSGGNVVPVPAISQDDLDRVRARLLQELQQRAYAEMQTDPFIGLTETEFIPLESLMVVLVKSELASGIVGQPATEVSLDMQVTVQAVAIDERLAKQVVYSRMAQKIGSGYQITASSLDFRRNEVTNIDDQRRVTFIMQGVGDVISQLDPEHIRDIVRGKPIADATSSLERELSLSAPPSIEMFPQFWPIIPPLSLRINVSIAGNP